MPVTMSLRSVGVGAVAAALLVGAYAWGHTASAAPESSPSPAPVEPTSNGIAVSGIGRVTGTPNLLRLRTSVNVVKPDVNSAMQGANTTMAAVQNKLKADGVAAADLQTSGLSVQPDYDYTSSGAKLKGYRVSENLSVVLRDLPNAGSVISDVAEVGGNELVINGASLDLDDDDALVAQARQKAFDDAKAKATAYAKAAGRSLGTVKSISESTNFPSPVYVNAAPMAADKMAAAMPIQAGSQDVTVTVSVIWSMGS